MNVTNTTSLPEPLFKAVTTAPYTRGESDISATALIDSPRKVALEEKYRGILSEDISQMGAMIGGNAFHAYVKGPGELDDALRLTMKVNGWVVSGQTDHVTGDHIIDYKTCRVAKYMRGLNKGHEDWEAQLNIYAELLRQNGYEVNKLSICAWLKDWSVENAGYENGYPSSDIVMIDIPLWPASQAQEYIINRVLAHQAARVSLPQCSPEELWGEDTWAVMRPGAKRASKVEKTEQDAQGWIDSKREAGDAAEYWIEYRQGEPRRCRFYCNVGKAGLCEQYEQAKLNEGVA